MDRMKKLVANGPVKHPGARCAENRDMGGRRFGKKLKLGLQKVAVWKGNPRLFQEDVFPIENGDIPLPS